MTWNEVRLERTLPNQVHWLANGKRLLRKTFTPSADGYWNMGHGTGSVALHALSDTAANVGVGISTKGTGLGGLYGNDFAVPALLWNSTGVGFNNAAPVAQLTGWGTPSNGVVVPNFDASTATLSQCAQALAKLLAYMKQRGDLGA